MEKIRNNYIDFLKGIGIILVILGHHKNILTNWIYSFHMPLFFILSGVFHKNEESFFKFIKKKSKGLLVPYYVLSAILFVFWLVIGRKYGESAINKTPIKESFAGIFYGIIRIKGVSSMEWGEPMWFLLCLFVVSTIFYFLCKLDLKKVILIEIFLFFISITSKKYIPIALPWNIQRAFIDIIFYSIGYYCRTFIKDQSSKKFFQIGIICLFVNLSIYFNNKYFKGLINYNIDLIYLIGGFFGSFAIINLFKVVKKNRIIEYLGKNTLILLAFHGRAMTFIKFIIIIILGNKLIEENLIIDIWYSILQIFLCLPAIFIFNKCFPCLIGKENKNLRNIKK